MPLEGSLLLQLHCIRHLCPLPVTLLLAQPLKLRSRHPCGVRLILAIIAPHWRGHRTRGGVNCRPRRRRRGCAAVTPDAATGGAGPGSVAAAARPGCHPACPAALSSTAAPPRVSCYRLLGLLSMNAAAMTLVAIRGGAVAIILP